MVRVKKIEIEIDGGISSYEITSSHGCCLKHLIPESVRQRLFKRLLSINEFIEEPKPGRTPTTKGDE